MKTINYKIACNGSWGFNIKTNLTDKRGIKIGHNVEGCPNEETARASCKEITDLYAKKGFEIVEVS